MAHEFAPEIVGLLTDGKSLSSKDSSSPDDKQRTIRELMGSIPDLTGGLSTEEYMRKIRGEFPTVIGENWSTRIHDRHGFGRRSYIT